MTAAPGEKRLAVGDATGNDPQGTCLMSVELGHQQCRNRTRIMDRECRSFAARFVEVSIVRNDIGDELSRFARRPPYSFDQFRPHARTHGHVEGDERHWPVCCEHTISRMRIAEDIGLCTRRDVAVNTGAPERTAHHEYASYQVRDAGIDRECSSQIGLPTHGHDRDLSRARTDRVDDESGRVVPGFDVGRHVACIPQTVHAVHEGRRGIRLADKGRRRTSMDGTSEREARLHEQSIASRLLDRRVAEGRGDPDEFNGGRGRGKEQGHGVIDAGIRVEDDRAHQWRASLPSSSAAGSVSWIGASAASRLRTARHSTPIQRMPTDARSPQNGSVKSAAHRTAKAMTSSFCRRWTKLRRRIGAGTASAATRSARTRRSPQRGQRKEREGSVQSSQSASDSPKVWPQRPQRNRGALTLPPRVGRTRSILARPRKRDPRFPGENSAARSVRSLNPMTASATLRRPRPRARRRESS